MSENPSDLVLRQIADVSPIGIYVVQDGQFQYVNPQFEQDTGYYAAELAGVHCLSIVHPLDRDFVRALASRMLRGEWRQPYEYRVLTKAGGVKWILESVASISYGGQRAAAGNFMDISRMKEAEQLLRERARSDSLTGLLNHGAILEEISRAIARRPAENHLVLMADMRAFKSINDTFGHPAGDEILRIAGRALSTMNATVGRYGGDEFVALLPGGDITLAQTYEAAARASFGALGSRLLNLPSSQSFEISFGAALFPLDATRAEDLVSLADERMYASRRVLAA